jgi:hypothetical protein
MTTWKITKHLIPGEFGWDMRLTDDRGTVIANLGMSAGPKTEALIAAAPDLLAACRACVVVVANACPEGSIMADLLAAIKKAEGAAS